MTTTAKKKPTVEDDVPDTAQNPRFRTIHRGKSRYADKRIELPLSGVRKAVNKTQVEVAEASGIDQGDVSRLERRDIDSMEVGTLRKYLAAIGVTLELVAIAGNAHIVIRSPDDDK